MGQTTGKGVSCLALTFFYDYLAEHGIPRLTLQKDLPYSPEYLDDRLNRIDYPTFLRIEQRMADLFIDDPQCFKNIGRSVADTGGFGFIRVLTRATISPFQLYNRISRLTNRFLFPFITITFQRTGRRQLRGSYRFDREHPPSDAFFETVLGILEGLPKVVGAKPATVQMRRVSPLEAVYDVTLSGRWLGLGDALSHPARRALKLARVRWQNLGEAAEELEQANSLLQEKVQDLTLAKSALDRRVRALSILNELSKVATSERDLSALLRQALDIISRSFDSAPTAILMAEGQPPGLMVAGTAGLDGDQMSRLMDLSDPDAPLTVSLCGDQIPGRLPSRPPMTLIPMVSRERSIGVFAMGEVEGYDASLLEPMASRLAVSIDNAVSYRLIADLRDNLELRVQQRTGELEQAKARLTGAVGKLERAQAAGREFFTNLSHEFKTPLTLILSPLDDLEARLKDRGMTGTQEDVTHIRHNARRLLHLIEEILGVAKLDAEQMPLNEEVVDLGNVVTDTVAALRPLADRYGIALQEQLPGEPLTVLADPTLLHRALWNLVSNAIRYCDRGDSVTVRLTQVAPHEEIVMEVEDTGPGIPEDQQERIFERFQRVTDSRGRGVEGSGIGLALVREIVRIHQGKVSLESTQNEGALFRITLSGDRLRDGDPDPDHGDWLGPTNIDLHDLPAADDDDSDELEDAPRSTDRDDRTGDGARILLVEDDPEMRRFLVRLLTRQHEVITAEDGERGLAAARDQMPDLVVSDVMMPRMDGYELCRRLKADQHTRNIPVVLVSAIHDNEASLHGFAAGAADFVVKPFSPQDLMARVNSQIRIQDLTRTVMRMERQTALGLLAAGVAHEVLNPVNVVINAVRPIRRSMERLRAGDGEGEAARRLLPAVESAGGRIDRVVKDMLRIASHGQHEIQQRASLCDGIESVLSLLSYRQKGIEGVHRDYRWEGHLMCYPDLLNQVVTTLVVNALDAMEEGGGGNIWIITEQAGDMVRVRVRDDGPGIPPLERDRIFLPFFTTKMGRKNAGMGLAIARDIIALHHGKLELHPGVDGGAEFVISIPLREPDSTEE